MNWARDLEACAHRRGCCQLWLREGVAKGSGLARAVAAARAGRAGGTASRCAGRVGFFPLVLWALFIRELGVREDQTARVPLELLRMTWLSPQQVLARCLAPDIEALTSAPAFQQSYWSTQHAALVPRGVGRQQCPHPCFLPAATRSDSGSFAAERCARDAAAGRRCVFQLATVIRAIKASLSRAPPPRRRARLQRETTPTAGRGLRAAIHA